MKRSSLFALTLRDIPAEAEVASHQLLLRAGYIRRISSGVYAYLPLMWRVLHKIMHLLREELNTAGAQELLLPILQPADLWERSGRWERYGDELMRLKDRHGRAACLAATAEEVITALADGDVHSYRQLPMNLYQIGNKYRDEIRPRFGLLRGREFIMKDGYSFHATQACLEAEYERMADAYTRFFERCGLKTKMVRSDSGAIGGAVSHEFMVLTGNQSDAQQSGENDVVYCDITGYAANSEKAEGLVQPNNASLVPAASLAQWGKGHRLETPNTTTIEALCKHTGALACHIVKTLLYRSKATPESTEETIAVLIRGDYEVEATKLFNALGAPSELRLATDLELQELLGTQKGFVGFFTPLCVEGVLPQGIRLLADTSLEGLEGFIIANNEVDTHYVNASFTPGLQLPWVDVRAVKAGDLCVLTTLEGEHPALQLTRGIEVGNIFQLGDKYSCAMNATFMTESGSESPFIMGRYGIGVSRVAAAAVERYHDANGLLWPTALAPYQVVIVPANMKDDVQRSVAEALYSELHDALGDEVLLDDREERAGVKFKDADLMGFPVRITVGKWASEGKAEIKHRCANEARVVALEDVLSNVNSTLASWDALTWEPSNLA